jgi:N-acetylmuramoyl-L-alanine amidase
MMIIAASIPAKADSAAEWIEITTRETVLHKSAGSGWSDNRLTRGALVEWLGVEKDSWYQVRMRNGEEGWVPTWLSAKAVAGSRGPAAFAPDERPGVGAPFFAKVVADFVSCRSAPYGGLSAKRDTTRGGDFPKGSTIKLVDKIGHWFQAQLAPAEFCWIYDEALTPSNQPLRASSYFGIPVSKLSSAVNVSDNKGAGLEFALSMQVPYMVSGAIIPEMVTFKLMGVDCGSNAKRVSSACAEAGGWCHCEPESASLQGAVHAPSLLAGFSAGWIGNVFRLNIPDSRTRRIKRIVIDPGHGAPQPFPKGYAEGTRNKDGLLEKDAVMTISRLLAERLSAEGFEVLLTRDGDSQRMMDLYERLDFAERAKADLFVSVHANGDVDASLEGVEVYWFEQQSRPAAEYIAVETAAATGRSAGAAFFGSFAVIRTTFFPAVLVETGYMTNPAEGKRYNDPEFLRQNAEGIARGVIRFADSLKTASN